MRGDLLTKSRRALGRGEYRKAKTLSLEPLEERRLLAVLISEFMADNEVTLADADGDFSDWIEIRNTGPDDANLAGWYLTDKADNLTKWQFPDTQLAAGDQIVVFASEKNLRVSGRQLHTNFKLSKDGEFLALVRPDGVTIAHAFDPAFPVQSADVSYGLSADGTEEGYFTIATPGQPNNLAPNADASLVVISEIMYKLPREGLLDAEAIDEEFIELHNVGQETVNLTGWKITRGVDFEFPQASVPAGGYLVVAANVDSFRAKYPDVTNVVGGWIGKLSNNGETIELVNQQGTVIDRLRYASEGDWSVRAEGPLDRGSRGWIWSAGHDGGDKSLELVNTLLPNDSGQNWNASIPDAGTPGQPNSTAEVDSAPLISDVIHSPAIPRADDEVVVFARLTDEQSGATAQLHWRVDGADEFVSATMHDDGQWPDVDAGDSLFAATIPAHADRTVIEFFVAATDVSDHRRTWPAPNAEGTQSANALYQVIDEFDQDAPWNPENVPVYFQVMTAAERDEFTNIVRQSDAQFNATFIAVDGSDIDVRYNTGVRIRGSASRNDPVPSNRINFPNDRPWQGVTRINVNAGSTVNNVAGAALFRLAGVEMANAHGIRMYSNGVDLNNGLYAHVEVLNDDYAELHEPLDSEGNLYRGRRPDESPPGGRGAGLAYFGTDPAPYVSYVKYTNESEADWSDVIQLTDVLNNSLDETFVEDVATVANVEQWFRAFAMNSLLGNTEAGLFTGDELGDDYAMYRGAIDPRFVMIPYDLDSLFRAGAINRALDEPTDVPALNRLINHPAFRYQYYAQYLDLIENILQDNNAEETLRQTLRGVASESRIEEILDFLQQRSAYVMGRINQQLTIDAGLGTVGGLPRTTVSALTLSGAAPEASTVSMTVNGYPVQTLDADRDWTFQIAGTQIVGSQTLLPRGAFWKYLDDGSDQGTSWRAAGFSDDDWQEGRAQLGYGDGDEATVISNGPGQGNAATTYFRTTFDVTDLSVVDSLSLQLVYDDAAAVYLNGVEVVRTDNLAPNADFDTFATDTRPNQVENDFVSFEIGPEHLLAGQNQIAVEVHQASTTSSDVSFDLQLTAFDVELIDLETKEELKLLPGLNRYTVRAFDGPDGSGQLVAEEAVDVWLDNGFTSVSGDIVADTTWVADEGPYLIQSDITVEANATLDIQSGTTVFFANNAQLTVRGQLRAIGKPFQEIRFTRQPGTSDWNGIQFRDSMGANRIEYAIVEYGVTNDGMLGLENSSLTLEHVVLDNTDRRRIRSIDSSLVVRDSTFTSIFDPGEQPTTNNLSEHIWGRGIPSDGQWIVENNVFGHITGHNDSIDFDAPRRPNPIPIIRNNLFLGGGDDALDMTGDVWIEGNTFQNFMKDEFNTDPGESNTISSSGGDFWVLRNLFRNVQHASLVKEDAFMHFLNNTVVGSEFAPLYFDLPGQTSGPGRGAIVQNSVLADAATSFQQVQPDTDLTVTHSFLTEDARAFEGSGNLFGNPHVSSDGVLGTGSFAIGAGSDGQDMGANVPAGATVSGLPVGTTAVDEATARVGGAAITHYRYRLDGGAYGPEISVDTPIQLSSLSNGTHVLSVVGKNELGIWQEDSAATTAVWTVDSNAQEPIVISEILANNSSLAVEGAFPDLIELYNPGLTAVNLSGFSLTDNVAIPDRFVFPANTLIDAHQRLVLIADTLDGAGMSVGFALSDEGEELYLFDNSPVRQIVDSVQFGFQIPDLSISRLGHDLQWGLSVPTLGAPNQAHPVADSSGVVINEWYANGDIRLDRDFVELFNSAEFPADISDHFLSDRPFAIPDMSPLRPLSFIGAQGFVELIADGNVGAGPDHVAFGISPELEQIGLFTPDLQRVDVVFSPPQTAEISMGRVPDGTTTFEFHSIPTPGASNGSQSIVTYGWGIRNTEWQYEVSGTNLGTDWREADYDDSAWPTGDTLIGVNSGFGNGVPIQTEIEIGPPTFYFRKTFTLADDLDLGRAVSSISAEIDDGYVVYLNGQEILRRRLPQGNINFNTLATENVITASVEGPFAIPNGVLKTGENVFAVEVHQSTSNFDIAFGLGLDIEATILEDNLLELLDGGLRISEIMYHSDGDAPLDFVELTNISDQPLDLTGVRLTDGIEFVFPAMVLQPHQFVVVAQDADAFVAQYGLSPRLAGQYSGNLSNGGETLALQFPDPIDTAILRFSYSDNWYPTTDGQGRSLEIVDPNLRYDRWSTKEAWQASTNLGGSPGTDGSNTNLPGDFNGDRIVDHRDIDLLCGGIRSGTGDYDLDDNGSINLSDLEFLIERILHSSIGDANLDGVFDSGDFVTVFRAGEYEDGIDGNSTWAEGDWNCDGEFSTGDLVYAFQRGSYTPGSVAGRPHSTPLFLDPTGGEFAPPETSGQSASATNLPMRRATELDVIVTELIFDEYQAAQKQNDLAGHDDLDRFTL